MSCAALETCDFIPRTRRMVVMGFVLIVLVIVWCAASAVLVLALAVAAGRRRPKPKSPSGKFTVPAETHRPEPKVHSSERVIPSTAQVSSSSPGAAADSPALECTPRPSSGNVIEYWWKRPCLLHLRRGRQRLRASPLTCLASDAPEVSSNGVE